MQDQGPCKSSAQIALSCVLAPEGHARWTLKLLAERAVDWNILHSSGRLAVCLILGLRCEYRRQIGMPAALAGHPWKEMATPGSIAPARRAAGSSNLQAEGRIPLPNWQARQRRQSARPAGVTGHTPSSLSPHGTVTLLAIDGDTAAIPDMKRATVPATDAISYVGYHFPLDVIGYAVWLYYRFPLSFRMVVELLAARGIELTCETVRRWSVTFGLGIAWHGATPARQAGGQAAHAQAAQEACTAVTT